MRATIAALALVLAMSGGALAHVQNERSLYEDIQFSSAQKQIVYLRGISAISPPESGPQLFRPELKLSRAELAYWASMFRATPVERETKNADDYRRLAVDKQLVSTLEGDATYADVNRAYFDNRLRLEHPNDTMTHEQLALFLGSFLESNPDGPSLFQLAGVAKGPVGMVEKVDLRPLSHNGEVSNVYFMTIGGSEYQVSHHPKMLYGPTDLTFWKGKSVTEAWLMQDNGVPILAIAALPEGAFAAELMAVSEHGQSGDHAHDADHDEAGGFEMTSLILPSAGLAALLAIAAWLFWRQRGNV